jgi:vacuolar protein sorting-associated protein VTA1
MISHLLYVVNPASDGPAATSYTPASNSSAPTHYHSTAESSPQLNPPAAPPASQYKYDSSYQPEVEKIAEAHKAARFAVGALAFDDVSVAVDHLKRALDLLTNPSAEPH